MSSAPQRKPPQFVDDDSDGKTKISVPIEPDQSPLDRAFSERTVVGNVEDYDYEKPVLPPPPPFTRVVGGNNTPKPPTSMPPPVPNMHQPPHRPQQAPPQHAPHRDNSEITFSDLSPLQPQKIAFFKRFPAWVYMTAGGFVVVVLAVVVIRSFTGHSSKHEASNVRMMVPEHEAPPAPRVVQQVAPLAPPPPPPPVAQQPVQQAAQPRPQEVRPSVTPPPQIQSPALDALTQKFDRAFYNTQGQFQAQGAGH